jgi:hypothetical protein
VSTNTSNKHKILVINKITLKYKHLILQNWPLQATKAYRKQVHKEETPLQILNKDDRRCEVNSNSDSPITGNIGQAIDIL